MMHKDLMLDMKAVNEDGTFEGMLSVYNVVDLGGDMVRPGAFTKTIKDNGGRVPMLWQHDEKAPIGDLELSDTDEGLLVKGKLVLDVEEAKKAYALLKAGVIRGLSIGYKTVKSTMEKGVRHLTEIKLYEGSVVTFPMNPAALVSSVKAEQKSDFATELENAQVYAMQWMMFDALQSSLRSFVMDAYYEGKMTRDEVIAASDESIDQFQGSYREFLPKLLDLYNIKSMIEAERKAGRRLSETTRASIGEAIAKLQALLGEEAASTSNEAAGTSTAEAAEKSTEPDAIHSMLRAFSNGLRSVISAQ